MRNSRRSKNKNRTKFNFKFITFKKHTLFFSIKIMSLVSNILLFKLFLGKPPGLEKQQIKQKINVPPYKIISIIDNIILVFILLSR